MAILDFIKGLFKKEEALVKKSVQELMRLAPEERDSRIRDFLYQFCFDNAAKFVHEELHRAGSPFVCLPRDHFFNEMLLMNFWMVDKVFRKYKPGLAAELHLRYYGVLPNMPDRVSELARRFKTYYNEWDDYTGHQDLFGMKVGELLFGSKHGYSGTEVSFWVISYSDEAVTSLKKIRKAYRDAKFIELLDKG
ncbi:MAG: hypothetical protein ACYC69_00915 [Thermodesulfovibrionales bacterium]